MRPGETYFVAGSISMGVLVGHPHLNLSNVAAFEGALSSLTRVQTSD